jgi:hypothetical protein
VALWFGNLLIKIKELSFKNPISIDKLTRTSPAFEKLFACHSVFVA